jgi:hypothetical protein
MRVLRVSGFETTYKRHGQAHASMEAISVGAVFEEVLKSIQDAKPATDTPKLKEVGVTISSS